MGAGARSPRPARARLWDACHVIFLCQETWSTWSDCGSLVLGQIDKTLASLFCLRLRTLKGNCNLHHGTNMCCPERSDCDPVTPVVLHAFVCILIHILVIPSTHTHTHSVRLYVALCFGNFDTVYSLWCHWIGRQQRPTHQLHAGTLYWPLGCQESQEWASAGAVHRSPQKLCL